MCECYLALLVLLLSPHRCWNYGHVPPCLGYVCCGFMQVRQALYQLSDTLVIHSLRHITSVSPVLCIMFPSPSSPT